MRISAIGCIVFVGAIAFAALKLRPTPVPPPSIPSDADKIDFAIVETINAARASLLTNLKSGEAWGELGMRFMAHEFVDRAAICFEQAAVYSNRDARWPYLHARCVDQIDAQKGIELLRQSVALCGNQPSGPRLTLVELLLQQQQLDEAQRELDAFLLYAPTEPRARHAKARLLAIQGDFQACATEIEAINKRVQQQHLAMQSQYQELMKQGRKQQAAATRERANRLLRARSRERRDLSCLRRHPEPPCRHGLAAANADQYQW